MAEGKLARTGSMAVGMVIVLGALGLLLGTVLSGAGGSQGTGPAGSSFATSEQGAKAAYQKFRNPASRYAIVGVFVAKGKDGVRAAVVPIDSPTSRSRLLV